MNEKTQRFWGSTMFFTVMGALFDYLLPNNPITYLATLQILGRYTPDEGLIVSAVLGGILGAGIAILTNNQENN